VFIITPPDLLTHSLVSQQGTDYPLLQHIQKHFFHFFLTDLTTVYRVPDSIKDILYLQSDVFHGLLLLFGPRYHDIDRKDFFAAHLVADVVVGEVVRSLLSNHVVIIVG